MYFWYFIVKSQNNVPTFDLQRVGTSGSNDRRDIYKISFYIYFTRLFYVSSYSRKIGIIEYISTVGSR